MNIKIEKRKLILPNVRGRIQAWLVDEINNQTLEIFEKDYLSYKKNLTPNNYLNDLASLALGFTPDMGFKKVALSTAYDPPAKENSTLILEMARKDPSTDIIRVNNKIIVECAFGSDVVTAVSNITAVTSLTKFSVNSVGSLSVGDRIAVKVSGLSQAEERKITVIDGLDITVHLAFSAFPVVSTGNCKQMISRLHLVYGAGATGTLNTGYGVSVAQIKTTKLSTQTLYTRHEIEYLAA